MSRTRNVRQPNYYRILGVSLAADAAEIRRAYRALAKSYHPDRVPAERREWARAQMARINAAYEVLGDPTQRSQYDYQQGYASNADRRTAADSATTAWRPRWHAARHTQRVRERTRRTSAERRRTVAQVSASALGIVLLAVAIWYRWLGLAIALLVGTVLVVAALKLTEL